MARTIKVFKNGNIGIWSTVVDGYIYVGSLQGAKDFLIKEETDAYQAKVKDIQDNFPNGRRKKREKGDTGYGKIDGYQEKAKNTKKSKKIEKRLEFKNKIIIIVAYKFYKLQITMKILAIGDIHGRATRKNIISEQPIFDKVVFIGDYFDSRDGISADEQIQNFLEIVEYKKSNPRKAVLLLGNHDYQYLPGVTDRYTGYQKFEADRIQRVVRDAVSSEYIQMCYQREEYIFTHAGVSMRFLESQGRGRNNIGIDVMLNRWLITKPQIFGFCSEDNSHTGDHPLQSPIRIRPQALQQSPIKGLVQVVGHTQQKDGVRGELGIFLIDALHKGEYITVDEDGIQARTLAKQFPR